MQIKLTTVLAALSTVLLAQPANAMSYEGYASTVSCSGSAFGCNDNGGACCGPLPAGYGYSVQFDDLPEGTQGQGYTNQCSAFLFAVFGSGSRCWNGGGARATYMNWFHSASTRRSVAPAIEARGKANGTSTCAPDYFKYSDSKGAERKIKIPADDANAAETIAKLYTDKSYDALSTYEDY